MAADYLQIVGTSAPSERAFSSAKRTLTEYWELLSEETAQRTQCLKGWIEHETA
jgi:hypothetical protein